MKPKVLLTGANGFIGGYLSEKLLAAGYDVHGIVQEGSAKTKGVIAYQGDLMDFKGIEAIVYSVMPDFIIHLAARTEVEKSFYDPIEFSSVNYVGTVNLIEKAKSVPNLKLFVFSSTMETYGWQPNYKYKCGKCNLISACQKCPECDNWLAEESDYRYNPPFDEETEQNPNAPYAVAKVGCELYLKYAERAYGLPSVILRQTNTYGRWDNDFFVVEQIITQMLKNKKSINLGYAEPFRNFLYIDDLISLYMTILSKYDDAKGNIFCTGPNNALKIAELADIIAFKLKWKGKINWNQKPRRPGEIYYLNSTPLNAEKVLGWKPQTNLSEGLDKTIAIWKKQILS